jgi:peptidoglycan/xylan/chitin deacetylase (PgdA/CDA1 family)
MRTDTSEHILPTGPTYLTELSNKKRMNIILSMDYEVFFGHRTGTVKHTLLEPSQALCDIAKRHRIPLVFFVDVGFLLRLQEEGHRFPTLMHDYDRIMRQLEQFVIHGHEIQLHVHTHWEDSHWNGESWNIDTRRYRLHDFGALEINEIIQRYTDALRSVTGNNGVFAFRAGGWVIQPFAWIREALLNTGICIDSTVFPGGRSEWKTHDFDFSDAPSASHWFFDNDPLLPCPEGEFLEVPIASYPLSPVFYWRFAITKKLGGPMHRVFSDGIAVSMTRNDLLEKLTCKTTSMASIDGYKASYLMDAISKYEREGKTDFVVMGHPKAITRYSIQQLEHFIASRKASEFVGYEAYRDLLINRKPYKTLRADRNRTVIV